jgi:hypothetical protein
LPERAEDAGDSASPGGQQGGGEERMEASGGLGGELSGEQRE